MTSKVRAKAEKRKQTRLEQRQSLLDAVFLLRKYRVTTDVEHDRLSQVVDSQFADVLFPGRI